MSLRLICGKAGSGKTETCLNEIKDRIKENKKIYIITPEQYSYTAEKRLLEKLGNKSVINAEVLTFARMSYRALNDVGGITKPNLSKAGKAMLYYDILEKQKDKLTFLGKSDKNIELIDTQITELKKHQVSVNKLKEVIDIEKEDVYLQKKLEDIYSIYKEYEQALYGKYIEENDKLDILASQLKKTTEYNNVIFYIDEFDGFTKQEYSVIEELLKIADEINVTITTDDLDMTKSIYEDLFYSNKQVADKLLFLARSNNIQCEKTLFLDNTYRFKNDELKHLEENINKIPYSQYNKEIENIELYLAKNPYLEIENIAKQIIKLIRNEKYRYKDIVIISKQLQVYGSLIKAIFGIYNIPVFIDEKKQLNQNLFAKYILAILEIYSSNWSYESVIGYLKTGFIDADESQIYEFENTTRKWGIKGQKWYKDEWNFFSEDEEEKEKSIRVNIIRNNYIKPLLKLKEKFNNSKTVASMNTALYEFLVENNIIEKLKEKQKVLEEQGKIELAKEQESAWDAIIKTIEEMNELFGENKTTFAYYKELLKVGLNKNPLGRIPETQDQVIVGDVDRTRTNKVKAVFLVGVNDGIFPSIRKEEGFLNDEDRKELKNKNIELAKGTLENLYEENFIIYKAFTTAEEKLYVSYSSSDSQGASLRPSIYVTRLKKIFTNLKEKSDIQEEIAFEIINDINTFNELIKNIRRKKDGEHIEPIWDIVYEYYKNKDEWKEKLNQAEEALEFRNEPEDISNENINKMYGNTLVTSISKLEKYQSCPFSYYLKYGLKLKPEDEYKMKSIDTGTFMHETIDEFFHIVRQEELEINELNEEKIYEIIQKIIEEKLGLPKYYIFTSSEKFRALTNKLKKVVYVSMQYIIEGLKNSDFKVMANELEFKKGKEYKPIELSLEDGKKVEITGKIDRIDIAKTKEGNYIRIIDYKSSVKNIDLNEVMAGLQIQLITYLDAACKIEQMMPAGILYYNLIDPVLKSNKPISKENIEEEIKKKFKMNGIILADVNVIKMMDKKLEKGSSNIVPAYLDKDGNVSKSKSNTLTKYEFEDLMEKTNSIIKDISRQILRGNIKISPYYQTKNNKTACDYCEFKEICNYKEKGCIHYNYIKNDTRENILSKIRKERDLDE